MSKLFQFIILVSVLFSLSCSGGNEMVAPTPLPTISCPAEQSALSIDGTPVPVAYPTLTVVGGAAPVTTTCTPPSGSAFSPGSTTVTCSATDAQKQTASCSFNVSIKRPPEMTVTKFMAFGDSLTAGVIDSPCNGPPLFCSASSATESAALSRLWRSLDFVPQVVSVEAAYPTALRGLLASRYLNQSPVVNNQGLPGERVLNPERNGLNRDTSARLTTALLADRPQVLLLQEGINDLNDNDPAEIPEIADALRRMVVIGRNAGAQVILGTLLPERLCSCRAFAPNLIPAMNDQIRAVGVREGVPVVDLYSAFVGHEDVLLGGDGLHPTPAGYQQMAEAFFNEIRARYEIPTGTSTARVPR